MIIKLWAICRYDFKRGLRQGDNGFISLVFLGSSFVLSDFLGVWQELETLSLKFSLLLLLNFFSVQGVGTSLFKEDGAAGILDMYKVDAVPMGLVFLVRLFVLWALVAVPCFLLSIVFSGGFWGASLFLVGSLVLVNNLLVTALQCLISALMVLSPHYRSGGLLLSFPLYLPWIVMCSISLEADVLSPNKGSVIMMGIWGLLFLSIIFITFMGGLALNERVKS